MNPRFSVIMPLYNKAQYVRKALESVMAQTYDDWECIIVNDGSSDNSLEVVKNFVDELKIEDRRLKIVSQENAGVAAARNRGVMQSKGEYVCFLDADDWWEPNFIDEIDKLIIDYPNAGIYCTNYIYYKPGKTRVALDLQRGYMNYPEAYLNSEMMPVTSITTCMPRKVFEKMGGFPLGIKLGEDFLLWAKTAVHYKVAFCEKPLAYYNNDVPASLRATRNLHAPEHNMLFHLDSIEEEIEKVTKTKINTASAAIIIDKDLLEVTKNAHSTSVSSDSPHGLECNQPQVLTSEHAAPVIANTPNMPTDESHVECLQKTIIFDNPQKTPKTIPSLESEKKGNAGGSGSTEEWKALLDKLRVGGLMKYWMSEEYHDVAAKELGKVDWSKQPKSLIRKYKTPIWLLKAKQDMMHIGSYWKQKLLLIVNR